MIDVRELRIGNIVSMDDVFWTIHTIHADVLQLKNGDDLIIVHPDNVEGVPLTAELLVKYGFANQESYFIVTKDVLIFWGDKFEVMYRGSYIIDPQPTLNWLQNAVFYLTGTELNVNP